MDTKSLLVYLSTYVLILTFIPIFVIIIQSAYEVQFNEVIIYHTILAMTLIFTLSAYFVKHRTNRKLLSQRILMVTFLLKIVVTLLQLLSLYILNLKIFAISEIIFRFNHFLNSCIPLLLLYFIAIYQGTHIRLRSVIVGSYIAVSSFGISGIGYPLVKVTNPRFIVYIFQYPTFTNAITVTFAYFIAGYYIIRAIYKRSNFPTMRYRPLLSTQYSVILLGNILFFYISPLLSLLKWFYHGETMYTLAVIDKTISLLGLVLIVLPQFLFVNYGFTLIPQSIEKLVVMNNIGLSLFSHDFIYQERILYSDLLITSSLSAIMTYLTHSEIISSRVKAIRFEDRILIFTITKGFTFLMIVKKNTNLLTSAINTFANEFVRLTSKSYVNAGFIKISPLNKWELNNLTRESFGTVDNLETELEEPPELQKIKGGSFPAGKSIVALALTLSALRNAFFQSSTVLLPVDNNILNYIIFLLFPLCLLTAGSYIVLSNRKITSPVVYIGLILQLILPYVNVPILRILLSFIFGFIMLGYLISHYYFDLYRVEPVWRYRIFLYGFLLDILIRIGTLGTEITVFHGLPWISVGYRIGIALVFVLLNEQFKIEDIDVSAKEIKNSMVILSALPISLLLAIRFFLNSSVILFLVSPYIPTYFITTATYIGFFYLLTLQSIMKVAFRYIYAIWIISVVCFVSLIYFIPPGSFLFAILYMLTLPLLAFIMATVNMYVNPIASLFNNRNAIALLHILIAVFTIVVMIYSYYGGPLVALLIPIGILFCLNLPIGYIYVKKFSSTQILSFSLIVVIMLSLGSLLLLFNQPTLSPQLNNSEFGVMTYNIHYGVGVNNQYDPQAIAKYIIDSGVSVVGLEEVTRSSIINGNGDLYFQLKNILSQYGFQYSLVMPNDPEVVTNALFSKYPIASSFIKLYDDNAIFPRGLISASINVRNTTIDMVVTHLTHVYTEQANQTRIKQIELLLQSINMNNPVILVGDFNITPNSIGIDRIQDYMTDNWVRENFGSGYTWSSTSPIQRIDYIFSRNIYAHSIIVDNVAYSDHLPVIAWF